MLPLSCDWLALSLRLRGSVMHPPEGYKWGYYSKTNVWESRWCLFNEYGEKVFTLLFQPRQSIIHADCAVLEVANEWLYHGMGQKGILDLLSNVVDYQIMGISRLDLAVDFNPDSSQVAVIRGLNDGTMYVGGKRNGNGWWNELNDNFYPEVWRGRVPHDMNWGHKTSDVRWKLYYKTKELRDAAGGHGWDKPYIVDMWREHGLDVTNVWRLEVSIHNCNNFNFKGDKLTYDRYRHTGSDLFQALYTSRFKVSLDEGHKDRSNNPQVHFLDIGALRGAFKVRRKEALAEHNGRLTLLRHLCNDVQSEQVLLDDVSREAVIAAVGSIIEQDRFHRYFREVVGMEFDDWTEWLRVKAYYYGEENKQKSIEDNTIMEMAMLDAGLVIDHTQPATASKDKKHNINQLKIQYNDTK